MKSGLIIIAVLFLPFAGMSQTKDRKAKEYYDAGVDKVSKKNFAGAIKDFSDALTLDSGFMQAYVNRGVAKYYGNDIRGAIEDYNKALKIKPDGYHTYGRRGWAEFYLQEYSEAINDFTKAIEGRENVDHFLNIRGEAKYSLKDYSGAIADFDRVIRYFGGDKNQKSKAYYFRGMAEISQGQKDVGCLDLIKASKSGNSDAKAAIEKYCR